MVKKKKIKQKSIKVKKVKPTTKRWKKTNFSLVKNDKFDILFDSNDAFTIVIEDNPIYVVYCAHFGGNQKTLPILVPKKRKTQFGTSVEDSFDELLKDNIKLELSKNVTLRRKFKPAYSSFSSENDESPCSNANSFDLFIPKSTAVNSIYSPNVSSLVTNLEVEKKVKYEKRETNFSDCTVENFYDEKSKSNIFFEFSTRNVLPKSQSNSYSNYKHEILSASTPIAHPRLRRKKIVESQFSPILEPNPDECESSILGKMCSSGSESSFLLKISSQFAQNNSNNPENAKENQNNVNEPHREHQSVGSHLDSQKNCECNYASNIDVSQRLSLSENEGDISLNKSEISDVENKLPAVFSNQSSNADTQEEREACLSKENVAMRSSDTEKHNKLHLQRAKNESSNSDEIIDVNLDGKISKDFEDVRNFDNARDIGEPFCATLNSDKVKNIEKMDIFVSPLSEKSITCAKDNDKVEKNSRSWSSSTELNELADKLENIVLKGTPETEIANNLSIKTIISESDHYVSLNNSKVSNSIASPACLRESMTEKTNKLKDSSSGNFTNNDEYSINSFETRGNEKKSFSNDYASTQQGLQKELTEMQIINTEDDTVNSQRDQTSKVYISNLVDFSEAENSPKNTTSSFISTPNPCISHDVSRPNDVTTNDLVTLNDVSYSDVSVPESTYTVNLSTSLESSNVSEDFASPINLNNAESQNSVINHKSVRCSDLTSTCSTEYATAIESYGSDSSVNTSEKERCLHYSRFTSDDITVLEKDIQSQAVLEIKNACLSNTAIENDSMQYSSTPTSEKNLKQDEKLNKNFSPIIKNDSFENVSPYLTDSTFLGTDTHLDKSTSKLGVNISDVSCKKATELEISNTTFQDESSCVENINLNKTQNECSKTNSFLLKHLFSVNQTLSPDLFDDTLKSSESEAIKSLDCDNTSSPDLKTEHSFQIPRSKSDFVNSACTKNSESFVRDSISNVGVNKENVNIFQNVTKTSQNFLTSFKNVTERRKKLQSQYSRKSTRIQQQVKRSTFGFVDLANSSPRKFECQDKQLKEIERLNDLHITETDKKEDVEAKYFNSYLPPITESDDYNQKAPQHSKYDLTKTLNASTNYKFDDDSDFLSSISARCRLSNVNNTRFSFLDNTRNQLSFLSNSKINLDNTKSMRRSVLNSTKMNTSRISLFKSGKNWRRSMSVAARESMYFNDVSQVFETTSIFNRTSLQSAEPIARLEFNPRQYVLELCFNKREMDFDSYSLNNFTSDCKKIGEGAFGEVFTFEREDVKGVIKIMPIEGDFMVNGEKQKTFHEIAPEIVVSKALSELRSKSENNCEFFVKMTNTLCLKGAYPDMLLKMWDHFDEEKKDGSENENPNIFGTNQLYVALEFEHAGRDLECFVFNNATQALAAFKQIACGLAVAEISVEFEHRDLHWGNVLLKPTIEKNFHYSVNDKIYTVKSMGVKVSIIDFTLSRIKVDENVFFNDLSQDPDLFLAEGDYQFEIYRMMQRNNGDDWSTFEPRTNIFWLHYIALKMIKQCYYKNQSSKIHANGLNKLKEVAINVIKYSSANEFILNYIF